MNFKRFVSVSVLAATCAFSYNTLSAQTLSRDKGPAEIPPTSYTANQYVDSKGCVYIRAGVDGNVNWVPRVSRARKVVCGQAPSLSASSRTATATARPAAPVQIQPAAPAPTATANVTAPKSPAPVRATRNTVASVLAPRPVRTVASKPVVKQRIAPRVQASRPARPSTFRQDPPRIQAAPAPAPQRRIQAQPRIVRVAPSVQQPRRVVTNTQRRVATTQGCRGASAVSQQYIGRGDQPVRCGPQQGGIYSRAGDVQGGTFRTANGQVLNSVSPNAIVVPRHVYEQQQAAKLATGTPKGYRKAWKDDRLNTRRTHQTLGGKAQMDLIWTQTVPRRLIVRSTGRDVTRSFPGLRYPYTSAAQQNAAWSQGQQVVSTQGHAPRRVQKQRVVRQQVAQPRKQVRVSTRTSAPRKPASIAGKRYVQVGTFGVASNAQNTAARIQRMGLPVRIGKFNRGGKQMRIVLAGPFPSAAHVNGALRAVHNAGFRDAFARK